MWTKSNTASNNLFVHKLKLTVRTRFEKTNTGESGIGIGIGYRSALANSGDNK